MRELNPIDSSIPVACAVFPERQSPNRAVGQMDVWLGEKSEGVSVGMLMPPGGHFEFGQTPGKPSDASRAACAKREANEEWDIVFHERFMILMAVCWYDHALKAPYKSRVVYYFRGIFDGTPVGLNELVNPQPHDPRSLPVERMWPADRYWMSNVLNRATREPGRQFCLRPFLRRFVYNGPTVVTQRGLGFDYHTFQGIPLFSHS